MGSLLVLTGGVDTAHDQGQAGTSTVDRPFVGAKDDHAVRFSERQSEQWQCWKKQRDNAPGQDMFGWQEAGRCSDVEAAVTPAAALPL